MRMNAPENHVHSHVIVIGAGYAGLLAANRLAAKGARVTLVNDRDTFIDRIRLHEVIAGTRSVALTAPPLAPRLARGVELVTGRAVAVGETAGSAWVRLESDRAVTPAATISGDHLLLATGSGAGSGGWEWALDHRDRLAALPAGASVTVSGGGFTGIEVASEIAAARPDLRVSLNDPAGVGRGFSEAGRRHLLHAMQRLHVQIAGTPNDRVTADLTVDCRGLTLPTLSADSGLPVADDGAVIVEDVLQVRGTKRLWAAGDAARVVGQPHLRMACASAEPMAAQAADQIVRITRGEPLRPLSLGFVAQCLSLGRTDGLVQFVGRDDTPRERIWTGRPAAWAKAVVCWGAATVPARWSRHYAELSGPRTSAEPGKEPVPR